MRYSNSSTEREKLIIELSKNGGPLMFMTSEVVDLIIAERQRIEVGKEDIDHTYKLVIGVLLTVCIIILSMTEIHIDKQKKEIVQLQLDKAEMTQHLNQVYRALKDVDYQINVLTTEVIK